MTRKRLNIAVLAVVLLAGCKDNYGACEKAALDIGNGIATGMKSVDSLRVAGQISAQEETSILGYLKFANDANGAFGACAQQAHNAGNKAGAYTACAQTFQQTLTSPQELALIRVNNPVAQQNIQIIVNGVSTGIASLLTALGGK
jgi:hypothetical protein